MYGLFRGGSDCVQAVQSPVWVGNWELRGRTQL